MCSIYLREDFVNKNLIFILGYNLFGVNSNKSSRTFLLHVCPHCNYSTYLVGHLKRHLLVHSGERPYVCNVCNFRFNQKENLKRHMKLKHFMVIWKFLYYFWFIWKKKIYILFCYFYICHLVLLFCVCRLSFNLCKFWLFHEYTNVWNLNICKCATS